MPPRPASTRARRSGIVDLDHEGGDQLAPFRDQRIIGRELVGELRGAAALDVQHLLHLQPHGVEALEVEGHEGADFDAARPLERGDARGAVRRGAWRIPPRAGCRLR